MPSVRALMATHDVSLSTALQTCRLLESDGLLEARPRSGYFVRTASPLRLAPITEPAPTLPDPAQYIGMHQRISSVLARSQQDPSTFSLGGARGAPALYPLAALQQAAGRILRRDPTLYGEAAAPGGHPACVPRSPAWHCAAASRCRPKKCSSRTAAPSTATGAACRGGRRDVIAVESPTYYGLLQILESLGMRALEIPCSPQTGLSLEALELAVRTYDNIRAVVAMPNLQNPLGSIMPDAHKVRLVQWCEDHGVPLIEDDCLSGTADFDTPLAAAKAWDRTGNVIYCSSVHKMLAPGVRLGWIAGGKWHARVEMLKFALSRA